MLIVWLKFERQIFPRICWQVSDYEHQFGNPSQSGSQCNKNRPISFYLFLCKLHFSSSNIVWDRDFYQLVYTNPSYAICNAFGTNRLTVSIPPETAVLFKLLKLAKYFKRNIISLYCFKQTLNYWISIQR